MKGTFSVWTSVNDLRKKDEYVWETTNTIITYSNWRNWQTGYPYNLNSKGALPWPTLELVDVKVIMDGINKIARPSSLPSVIKCEGGSVVLKNK